MFSIKIFHKKLKYIFKKIGNQLFNKIFDFCHLRKKFQAKRNVYTEVEFLHIFIKIRVNKNHIYIIDPI